MPTIATAQYQPPESWEEFESMCADLYARIWQDDGTQKHGRTGQPQAGVDVYGRPDKARYVGLQCKEKGIWPPKDLTIGEIEEEIEKAEKFRPKISEFLIATTAPNDQKVQEFARILTEKRKKRGLFGVSVVSWNEITRKLSSYPDILKKYYPEIANIDVVKELTASIPKLVAEELRGAGLTVAISAAGITQIQDPTIISALERDLAGRFNRAMRRSLFPEAAKIDEFGALGDAALEEQYAATSSELRRTILLRASRSAAVRLSLPKAEMFLLAAQSAVGKESDLVARARILEAHGEPNAAIALLRDTNEPDARSTVLNLLFKHRGADVAAEWAATEAAHVSGLTTTGVHTLTLIQLAKQNLDDLRSSLGALCSVQLSEAPYFYFLRAAASLASILPIPDRRLAFRGVFLEVSRGRHSVLDPETTAARLDLALADLNTLLPITTELELRATRRIIDFYALWCELLHPGRSLSALQRLRNEMKDPAVARSRLPLAFAFDGAFKPDQLKRYLARREELGGLDDDDLQALLATTLHDDDPTGVATLIARHRARFEADYIGLPIFPIEIQALALSGDTASATILLEKHRHELPDQSIAELEGFISKAEGSDPVVADLRVYESNKSVDALRSLVMSLAQKKDHRATAKYSEELFDRTQDPRDIARTAQAFVYLGDGRELIRVMEAHPFLGQIEPGLLRQYAWQLFMVGRLQEAAATAERLTRSTPPMRDLQLEIAIAIETGEWEALGKPLSAYLEDVSKYTGLELIRAAALAQASGQGAMMDLVRAAVAKAEDDPHVWLGAYTIVIEEGLEDEVPEANEWFSRAIVLSDKDGPVQQFDLKELLPKQVEWNTRTLDISERLSRAEMPFVVAAPGLRTTVVNILLRNLVRNSRLDDPRRMFAIPLFSGHRAPERCGPSVNRLGLDVSSLLVLGWLGLLPTVLSAFDNVTLAARVMAELFEGRRRLQDIQKSRIWRARELEQAIGRGRIKIVRPIEIGDSNVSDEVGPSLAAMLRVASDIAGVVLRPGPIHRPGLEQIPAEIEQQLPLLTDTHALLKVLRERGAVDQALEETAKQYLVLQDKGLAGCAEPVPERPLILDPLGLVYLQYAGLLDSVFKTFSDVRIESAVEEEALAIIEHNQHVERVLGVVDEVRAAIREANRKGKVTFGPRRAGHDSQRDDEAASTLHLLNDLTGVDALVCDDRALNKENFAEDIKGVRIPLMTSLDLLEELSGRGTITAAQWRAARHKLRTAGANIMPVQLDELLNAAARTEKQLSAEMRAIEVSIDLARAAEMPSFPREIQWFARTSMVVKSALLAMWKSETDLDRAERLSSVLWNLTPKPDDWAGCWVGEPPIGWRENVVAVSIASLCIPVELDDPNVVAAYNKWLEKELLDPLRVLSPERHRAVVKQIEDFIERGIGGSDEE